MGQRRIVQRIPAVVNWLRGLHRSLSVHDLYGPGFLYSYRDKMKFFVASLSDDRLDCPVDESVWRWMPAAM